MFECRVLLGSRIFDYNDSAYGGSMTAELLGG